MTLFVDDLPQAVPPIGTSEGHRNPFVYARFFHAASGWSWWVLEFDGIDLCFGLVYGFEREYGYFTLSELTAVRGPFGLGVERDLQFEPCRLNQLPQFDRGSTR